MKLILAVLMLTPWAPLFAQVRPIDLRCEYRLNPVGIDVTSPRLSWIVSPTQLKARGVSQSAYRVIIASSPKKLSHNVGDLWDTGKISSPQSIQLAYAGETLTSGVHAFWKVQIWDQNGKPSPWSEPAFWSEGLLTPGEWTAKWIGHEEKEPYKDPRSPFRYLRNAHWIWTNAQLPQNVQTQNPQTQDPQTQNLHTTITIPEAHTLKNAVAVLSADKAFELFLNGERVDASGTVRAPAVWDITRYLKSGENSVLVKVTPVANSPGLIGAFHIDFERGNPLDVVTDSTWLGENSMVTDLGAYGMAPWGEVGYMEERALPARMLRKEFQAERAVTRATAYISGLGLFEMYINGAKLGDQVLSPNLTDYDKRVHYVTFDVTRELKSGNNAIGLILGNGRYWAPRWSVPLAPTRSFGYPKARLQLDIEYANGKTTRIISDETWKLTTDGPIRANNEYDGERYDATSEIAGWAKPGFDDSKWPAVELVPAPTGVMVAQNAEPLRVMQTVKPVKVTELRPGVYVFDMGQNMVGWCRLHVSGPKGTEVTLQHAETLQPNGELYIANLRSARATDTYILRGGTPETWEPRFTYHGFRYVELKGYPGVLTLAALEGRVVHDAMAQIADFTSSDQMLNQIHHNVFWGVRSNYRSIPTDCPQRDERQGWLGDRSVVSRSESYLFNVAAFYTKWERDIADSQSGEGSIPDVSPNYWPIYNDDVTWPSTLIQVPAMLYDQYADVRVMQENYPAMKKWIEYMRGFLKDGLLPKDRYADWCVPPEDPKLIHSKDPARQTDGALLATAYFYRMNREAAHFARLIAKEPDAVELDRTAEEVKAAFNKAYFHADSGTYGNNTQTANILPLAFRMVPEEDRERVFNALINNIETKSNGHVATGLVGVQWLMRTLSEGGRADVALQIATQPTYPGWGYMVSKGATTVWELWNGDTADPAMNSGNHVMQMGDLGLWMYEDLAGIRPDPENPAFKHILIHPHPVKALSFVKASHQCMYGLISTYWKRENGRLTLNVTVPANTTATVWVPALKASDINEGGASIEKAPGVKFVRMDAQSAVVDVQSGSYSFSTNALE